MQLACRVGEDVELGYGSQTGDDSIEGKMKLSTENSETFRAIPLSGHISALKRGDKKYYWQVKGLIEKSQALPVSQMNVEELISRIRNGT